MTHSLIYKDTAWFETLNISSELVLYNVNTLETIDYSKRNVRSLLEDSDFSKSSPEYLEKNKKFLELLIETWNYTLYIDDTECFWDSGWYSLLWVTDKNWKTNFIPTPVLFNMLWIDDYKTEDRYKSTDNDTYEESEIIYKKMMK